MTRPSNCGVSTAALAPDGSSNLSVAEPIARWTDLEGSIGDAADGGFSSRPAELSESAAHRFRRVRRAKRPP